MAVFGKVELHRERVVLRRAVHGMQMAVNVRVATFSALRCAESTTPRCSCWSIAIRH